MKRRADAVRNTQRRIIEATVELHRTVGPAATRITDVAKKAGVQRVTVYNHFPDEESLLASCSSHWRSLHPSPDLAAWAEIRDHGERLRVGLEELYAWYRETEPMTANVLRDAELIPALNKLIQNGLQNYLAAARRTLGARPGLRGRRRDRVDGAVQVVADFHTWRALSHLGDAGAAELAARFVEAAAD